MSAARADEPPTRARILVVDDHPVVRHGLAALIGREPDLSICAEADSNTAALGAVAEHRPDLVLMDLRLPRDGIADPRHGLDLLRTLRAQHPNLPILVLSFHDESAHRESARACGATGYVTKQEAAETLIATLRSVLSLPPPASQSRA